MQTEPLDQLCQGMAEIKETVTRNEQSLTQVNTELKALKDENERTQAEFTKLQRLYTTRQTPIRNPRFAQLWGLVTDECAAYYGAMFVHQCAKSGKLELLSQSGTVRDALFKESKQILGLETRSALTTTDMPLPVGYSGELRALIAQFP